MLKNSFIHLPGIGPETEQRLWSSGLKTWDDLSQNISEVFGKTKAQKIVLALDESRAALEGGELGYFHGRFKSPDMWRLIPLLLELGLQNKIAYLDIETTGLGFPPESHSTTIAVYFNGELFVEHDHKKKYEYLRMLETEAKLYVTFNGGPFDLPFLRREFRLAFGHAHVDLRFWLARLGYRGGLKNIQREFEHIPQRDFMDIDGFDAVRLWNLHKRGVPRALETLMTYNAEDTVVLEQLMYCGLNIEAKKRSELGLKMYEYPKACAIRTSVCPNVYRLLR